MTIEPEKLTIMLNEYNETSHHLRHHDEMMARWSGIFLTLNVTLLSLSTVYISEIPLWSFIGVACFSIFLTWITLVIVERNIHFKDISLKRLVEIEKILDMKYYGQVESGRKKSKKSIGTRYTTNDVGKIAFFTYTVIWFVLIGVRLLIEYQI